MFTRPLAAVSALALASAAFSGTAAATTGVHLVGHLSDVTTGKGVHQVEKTRTVLTAITGLAAPVEAAIVADLNKRTARFVVPEKGFGGPWDLEDKLSLAHADARYVTVKQTTYVYAGGAHGESAIAPLTYSATSGKVLTVRSFAKPGKLVALLKVLSIRSRKSLAARGITADFYDLGTTPTVANFSSFEPVPTGWRVEFPQGDVADEAHGPLEVLVPWGALKGLLALPHPTA
ncbi:hypothetical protein acdb102_17180 [Acidothermaceae bacterium B102]|nr:hypothetical protein acdb102_17180 [Acidothermaceae bacterium B102]